jgi:hypothetical protein
MLAKIGILPNMSTRFSTLKARELVETYGMQAVDLATLEGAQAITRGDLMLARRWADTLTAVEELLAARTRAAGRLN